MRGIDGFVVIKHNKGKNGETTSQEPLMVSVKEKYVYLNKPAMKAMGSPKRVLILFDAKGGRLGFKVSKHKETYALHYNGNGSATIPRRMNFVKAGWYSAVFKKNTLVARLNKPIGNGGTAKTAPKKTHKPWVTKLTKEEQKEFMAKVRAGKKKKAPQEVV